MPVKLVVYSNMATINMFVLAWFKIRGLFSDWWLINEMFVLAWLIIRGLFSNRWLINEMFVLAWLIITGLFSDRRRPAAYN